MIDEEEPHSHGDRRRFTDADIDALCAAITKTQIHVCRFDSLKIDEVRDAVIFHRHVNALMSETGTTIRKTFLVLGVTGLVGLLLLGIYSKLKTALGL
ncbi:MAG: hypothetical protein ACOYB1_18455 [Limnohabitans sp.]